MVPAKLEVDTEWAIGFKVVIVVAGILVRDTEAGTPRSCWSIVSELEEVGILPVTSIRLSNLETT